VHFIRRNVQENEMRCFECEGVEHQCKDCPNRRLARGKAAHSTEGKAQQCSAQARDLEGTARERGS